MSVWFAVYIFDVKRDVFDGRNDCQGNMLDLGKKYHKSIERELYDDTASTFLKMTSPDGHFLYKDDFDAVISITDC